MQIKGKVILALVGAAVALIALYCLVMVSQLQNGTTQLASQTTYGTKKQAPAGQLAAGFPVGFVLDANAKISNSFSIPYQKSGQYTATFISAKTVAQEYNGYLQYLKASGFTILNSVLTKSSAHLYGTQATADANITISTVAGKTNVMVSYLTK